MSELIPCEKCGCKDANLWSTADFRTIVACEYCNNQTKPFATEAEAIQAWNRREEK